VLRLQARQLRGLCARHGSQRCSDFVPYDEGVTAAAWERLTGVFKKHLA
jgi:hypothetical protein